VTDAFSGEGARLYGGGWNSKGIPVVYTASSRALAILEMLVQDQPLRARYAIIAARIPSTVRIEHVSAAALPDTWATAPPSDELRAIGADWITRAKTAVLRVPSTVVPSEFNYLLNPAHREFHRIKLGLVETLSTDRRLLQKLSNKARRKSRQTR
jgi:RES domain-containing protein